MKYEFVTTQDILIQLQAKCDARLLNLILNEVKPIYTTYSNFWKFTSYCIDESSCVRRIDKIQVATLFLSSGGIIEFDGHTFGSIQHLDFWSYLFTHKCISGDEYEYLKNSWGFNEKITFMK